MHNNNELISGLLWSFMNETHINTEFPQSLDYDDCVERPANKTDGMWLMTPKK